MPPELSAAKTFTVSGDSMLPLLEPGDEVWVRREEAPAPGRLTVYARFFERRPSLVVHRLLPDGRTLGDANPEADEPQRPEDRLGVVVGFRRGGHSVVLGSRGGRALDTCCRAYGRLVLRFARTLPAFARLRDLLLAPSRALFRLVSA